VRACAREFTAKKSGEKTRSVGRNVHRSSLTSLKDNRGYSSSVIRLLKRLVSPSQRPFTRAFVISGSWEKMVDCRQPPGFSRLFARWVSSGNGNDRLMTAANVVMESKIIRSKLKWKIHFYQSLAIKFDQSILEIWFFKYLTVTLQHDSYNIINFQTFNAEEFIYDFIWKSYIIILYNLNYIILFLKVFFLFIRYIFDILRAYMINDDVK